MSRRVLYSVFDFIKWNLYKFKTMNITLLCIQDLIDLNRGNISSKFSSNYEAEASELLETFNEMFLH